MLFPNVIFTPIMYRGKRIATEKIAPHVHYIPFVSNLAEGENRRYCPDNCLRILDVGKYRDYKNHFYLIEALAPLKDRKDIRVTVIGQVSNSDERQYFEKLEQAVHLAELDSMVTLRENVSYRFMHQVYQEHDILVLPSKFESAGMAILEAMAEKMGVICSNNCGLPDHVESNNCGITFPLDNAEKLTEIIVKIADNKSIVERMGDNAAKAVNSQFSFENYFSSFMDMLRKEFKFDMKDVNPG